MKLNKFLALSIFLSSGLISQTFAQRINLTSEINYISPNYSGFSNYENFREYQNFYPGPYEKITLIKSDDYGGEYKEDITPDNYFLNNGYAEYTINIDEGQIFKFVLTDIAGNTYHTQNNVYKYIEYGDAFIISGQVTPEKVKTINRASPLYFYTSGPGKFDRYKPAEIECRSLNDFECRLIRKSSGDFALNFVSSDSDVFIYTENNYIPGIIYLPLDGTDKIDTTTLTNNRFSLKFEPIPTGNPFYAQAELISNTTGEVKGYAFFPGVFPKGNVAYGQFKLN